MTRSAARLGRVVVPALIGLWLVGCTTSGTAPVAATGPGAARTPAGQALTPDQAMGRITVGSSTRAEVAAALGPAIVVPFDSGYEVWLYRWPGADGTTRAASEVVLLFDASGRVGKLRQRPGVVPQPP